MVHYRRLIDCETTSRPNSVSDGFVSFHESKPALKFSRKGFCILKPTTFGSFKKVIQPLLCLWHATLNLQEIERYFQNEWKKHLYERFNFYFAIFSKEFYNYLLMLCIEGP